MSFAVGSLVRARGREWVVLPGSTDQLVCVRPLGGTDDESTGILTSLEEVAPAQFDLPDPSKIGDHRSCRLLRDALRLGFRSSAGPFRSFGRLAVDPRPYQLVPLLMALKLDPVRLLIADDVGIGKTIEAGLIARELMDRGDAENLAVLCPPHLAEQWQEELQSKFHIDAELVLPGTAARLERNCRVGQSLFDLYPMVIVSTDYIKSERRREEFLRTCPSLVIVDEAHTCAFDDSTRSGRHQRHELLKGLAKDQARHLILVTATPHSGKEAVFRSLLSLLSPEFATLPGDLAGKQGEHHRRKLAGHLVQRRRADLRRYLDAETPFPEREEAEVSYKLSTEYRVLFAKVLAYVRESIADKEGGAHRHRVRWWSALALLRALGSSPAAAAATLRERASTAGTTTPEEADEVGRRTVLDVSDDDPTEGIDVTPGSQAEEEESPIRRRLLDLARQADALRGEKDEKLKKAATLIDQLLHDGFSPIVFCRFIDTADYVAQELRKRLSDVEIMSVTGTLPPLDRKDRVSALSLAPRRVLVCTDCLSEGINLQDSFDAVLHYDLSWNPTRHEQREGRVDRFGQKRPKVRTVTYYGVDNQIDGIVLDVLIRKHKAIRNSLGIAVPIPSDTNAVLEAIFEGLLLRGKTMESPEQLILFEEYFKPKREELFGKWESSAAREKLSRTVFAQESIKVEDVSRELDAAREAIGMGPGVERFVMEAVRAHRGIVEVNGACRLDLRETPRALREAVGNIERVEVRFDPPPKKGELYLSRTHPFVEGLANFVLDTALDPVSAGVAKRAGVIRTRGVSKRTTALVVRYRFQIVTRRGDQERALLAEDCQLIAFAGSPDRAEWLEARDCEALVDLDPDANVDPAEGREFLTKTMNALDNIRPEVEKMAYLRAKELLEAHTRVREAAHGTGAIKNVEAKLPPDILGVYMFLPVTAPHV